VASGVSLMNTIAADPQAKAINEEPYSLVRNISELSEGSLPDIANPKGPCWSPAVGATTGPFMMSEQNEKIVHMSNALLCWKLGTRLLLLALSIRSAP
jgi:hypothetical protein